MTIHRNCFRGHHWPPECLKQPWASSRAGCLAVTHSWVQQDAGDRRMDGLEFTEKIIEHVAWPVVVLVGLLSQHRAFEGFIKAIENLKLKWGDKEASLGTRELTKQVETNTATVGLATAEVITKAGADPVEIPAFEQDMDVDAADGDKPTGGEQLGMHDRVDAEVIRADPVIAAQIHKLETEFHLRGGAGKSSTMIKAIALSDAAPNSAITNAWSSVRVALQKVVTGWGMYAKQRFTVFDIDDDLLISLAGRIGKFHPTLMLSIEQLRKIYVEVTSTDSYLITSSAARQYIENASQVAGLIEVAAADARNSN